MNMLDWGWSVSLERSFDSYRSAGYEPSRVSREDRAGYFVVGGDAERFATLAGRLRNAATDRGDLPAVGDWVAVEAAGDRAIVHAVLPRRSTLVRQVAGRRSDVQILAANVDTVFLVSGLDGDFNPRRLERYLTMALGSGASPVVLLNKADVCGDVEARLRTVQELCPGTPVHAISAILADGLAAVRAHLQPGRTAAFLGSSGVGKSTIINSLLGEALQRTADVRAGDDRGRHTTTRRELFLLPGGGVVIDTPGMRELQLAGSPDDVQGSFADVETLAANCRFRDCRHEGEPDCAVRAAVERGQLAPERLANLHKLRRELDFEAARADPNLQRQRTDKWKRIHKAAKRLMKSRRRQGRN